MTQPKLKPKLKLKLELLPANVPVIMPDLPPSLNITTEAQFKAMGDPVRNRILGIIQQQPATAMQISVRLNATPGAIGHHLKVLEQAGLAMVVAKRVTRGIIAKYYTRTARLFNFKLPTEGHGPNSPTLDIVTTMRNELAQAVADGLVETERGFCTAGFPRVRLSKAQIKKYGRRIEAIMNDLSKEKPDPNGSVMGFGFAFFTQPNYVQSFKSSATETQSNELVKHVRKKK